jgi:glutamate-1-semialdehyde 2,1-aminomutase
VYLPCSQFDAMFVSTAHTEVHITQTIAAAAEAFRVVADQSRSG